MLTRTKLYQLGKDQSSWYADTTTVIKRQFGEDHILFAGFLAATSINAGVKSNLTLALKALTQHKAGRPFTGYLDPVRENLERVVRGEPLSGLKIEAFRLAILGDLSQVVIDRWIAKAYDHPRTPTPKQYRAIARKLTSEAKRRKLRPAEYQAGLWSGV